MKSLYALLGVFLPLFSFAQVEANIEKGVMLKGYDPVSYFQESQPLKGNNQFQHEHMGLNYHFDNAENKAKFQVDPHRYIPQYGGWCATAVAGGYKYDIDPTHFKITDGKLYLFYKGWRGDAKKEWVKNEAQQILKADQNWPQVSKQKE